MDGDHTGGVAALDVLLAVAGGDGPTTSVLSGEFQGGEFTMSSVAGALVLAVFAALPLGLSLWALLDAARRPRWAWALADRRQVIWLALILFGFLGVVTGLFISGWYLTKVRPVVAAAEAGPV